MAIEFKNACSKISRSKVVSLSKKEKRESGGFCVGERE
jgi:hypothetical protein